MDDDQIEEMVMKDQVSLNGQVIERLAKHKVRQTGGYRIVMVHTMKLI
jgi:hypothetical protein